MLLNRKRRFRRGVTRASLVVLPVLFFSLLLHAHDLIIRNGRIIDGTGNPAVFADIAIDQGRISVVGRVANEATTVIDASGLVITPDSSMFIRTLRKSWTCHWPKISSEWA